MEENFLLMYGLHQTYTGILRLTRKEKTWLIDRLGKQYELEQKETEALNRRWRR